MSDTGRESDLDHAPGADPGSGHSPAFGAFFRPRDSRAQRRRRRVVAVSIGVHLALVVGLLVSSYWTVHRLSPPQRSIAIASFVPFLEVATPEQPSSRPAPPPKKGDGVRGKSHDRKLVTAKTLTRPVASDAGTQELPTEAVVAVAVEVDAAEGSRDSVTGVSDGIAGGVVGGEPGGVLGGALSALTGPGRLKPPPPPPRTRRVAFAATELRRISGTRHVSPNAATIEQIKRDHKAMVTATVELCLGASGEVRRVQTIETSGYPAYDVKIQGQMKRWRYRPFLVDGAATPVCTVVHFIHREERVSSL